MFGRVCTIVPWALADKLQPAIGGLGLGRRQFPVIG